MHLFRLAQHNLNEIEHTSYTTWNSPSQSRFVDLDRQSGINCSSESMRCSVPLLSPGIVEVPLILSAMKTANFQCWEIWELLPPFYIPSTPWTERLTHETGVFADVLGSVTSGREEAHCRNQPCWLHLQRKGRYLWKHYLVCFRPWFVKGWWFYR